MNWTVVLGVLAVWFFVMGILNAAFRRRGGTVYCLVLALVLAVWTAARVLP